MHVTVLVHVADRTQSLKHYRLDLGVAKILVPLLPLGDLLVQVALAVLEDDVDLAALAAGLSWRVAHFVAARVDQLLDLDQKRRAIQHLERLDFWHLQRRFGRGLRTLQSLDGDKLLRQGVHRLNDYTVCALAELLHYLVLVHNNY